MALLIFDMMFSRAFVGAFAFPGIEAVHASRLVNTDAADRDIIRAAVARRGTIVTMDLDYPRIMATEGLAEPSLIVFRVHEGERRQLVKRLHDVLRDNDLDGPPFLALVTGTGTRVRPLPLLPLPRHG